MTVCEKIVECDDKLIIEIFIEQRVLRYAKHSCVDHYTGKVSEWTKDNTVLPL